MVDERADGGAEPESRDYIRTDFSRGEVAGAMIWLSIGALLSVLLEVVYLGWRLDLPGGISLPFPITIAVAWGFNLVLTRTARLWTRNLGLMALPLAVWLVGFFAMMAWVAFSGDQLVIAALRSVVLLMAGVVGGAWPILRSKAS